MTRGGSVRTWTRRNVGLKCTRGFGVGVPEFVVHRQPHASAVGGLLQDGEIVEEPCRVASPDRRPLRGQPSPKA
jgi:hypothetical protein